MFTAVIDVLLANIKPEIRFWHQQAGDKQIRLFETDSREQIEQVSFFDSCQACMDFLGRYVTTNDIKMDKYEFLRLVPTDASRFLGCKVFS